MDFETLEGMGLEDEVISRILEALAPGRPAPRFVAPSGLGGGAGEGVSANVAQAREMGALRAAGRKTSEDILKNFL